MSEAPTINNPASLYPPDGGAAAAEAALAADTQTASAGADTVAGDAGADTIPAAAGNDTIAASAGNDTIEASGNNTLDGGAGNDSITADSYQFNLPEGFTDNAELTSEARSAMLAAGVKPEKAQDLINLFGKAVKASNDAAVAAHVAEQTQWLSEINAMPEFQGPTREKSMQSIARVFDEYGSPEAKAALERSGTGNNPALAKMFIKMAAALTEGMPVPQGLPPPNVNGRAKPQTVGQALYPDSQGT